MKQGPTVLVLVAALSALPACDGVFDVGETDVLDAAALDPARDGPILSRSAQQEFASVYGPLIVYSAWFAGEALVADFQPARNEFGLRRIRRENESLLNELWLPLSSARATAEHAAALLRDAPVGVPATHLARAELIAGYAFVFMAEHFCEGATDGGPLLDTTMMVDSAVQRFTHALEAAEGAAQAETGPLRAEAEALAAAALVGRARARLRAGRLEEAAADADRVPPGAEYVLLYIDDPANRARLSNRVWFFTRQRGSLAVAPAFRGLDDPRVPVRPPGPPLRANDGVTEFWTQTKYPDYAAPIRLASRLEADYIAAEARGTAAMLELIQARRAANGQPPYAGSTDPDAVLAAFIAERAREFYLEGKALGDFRRNPAAYPFAPPTGAAYHKPGYDPIGSQTCYPLPDAERAS